LDPGENSGTQDFCGDPRAMQTASWNLPTNFRCGKVWLPVSPLWPSIKGHFGILWRARGLWEDAAGQRIGDCRRMA